MTLCQKVSKESWMSSRRPVSSCVVAFSSSHTSQNTQLPFPFPDLSQAMAACPVCLELFKHQRPRSARAALRPRVLRRVSRDPARGRHDRVPAGPGQRHAPARWPALPPRAILLPAAGTGPMCELCEEEAGTCSHTLLRGLASSTCARLWHPRTSDKSRRRITGLWHWPQHRPRRP